jgi:3-oxoacyl-[acyl-carrier protein] reductase
LEDIMSDLSGMTTIVVGASRGLGHGIATALDQAGAKATQRPLTGYAQQQAILAGLDLVFTEVFPYFAPQTGVGHSRRCGRMRPVPASRWKVFLKEQGSLVTRRSPAPPWSSCWARTPPRSPWAYRLSGTGLQQLP